MFENLSEKLQRAFKNLRGQGTITEENIQEALREIRVALLEADVNLNVVRELIEHIRAKAIGQEVMTALSPSEQVVKIVHDELVTLLGKDTARFQFASRVPAKPQPRASWRRGCKRADTGPCWFPSTSIARRPVSS
jgi:signal recognition particle subunit SRP54